MLMRLRCTMHPVRESLGISAQSVEANAISEKACDKISIRKETALSALELAVLKEKSIVRRKEGLTLADKIVKDHRRDGRYFDELLRGEME